MPSDADLIAKIQVAEILEDADFDSLYSEIPKGDDDPQTLDDLLALATEEAGIDLRRFSDVVLFGDFTQIENNFGLIVRGSFEEDALIAAIDEVSGTSLDASEYKGHRVYDDGEEIALGILESDSVVVGSLSAVQSVIDVLEGDKERATGRVFDAFDDLGDVLVRLAVVVPPEVTQQLGGPSPFGDDLPIDLSIFSDIGIVGVSVDKQGNSIRVELRADFTAETSATDAGDALQGVFLLLKGLASDDDIKGLLGKVQVSTDRARVTVALEITISELRELAGSLEDGFEGLPFGALEEEAPLAEVAVVVAPTAAPVPVVVVTRTAPVRAAVPAPTATVPAPVAAPEAPVRAVVAAPEAPDFRISLYQGEEKLGARELNLSDLRGTPVILNLWAGLCPLCRAEMPMLQAFYDDYGDRVTLLGIDVGPFVGHGSSQDGKDLLEELDISYPAGSIPDGVGVMRSYLRAMPSTIFITAGGEIFRLWSGVLDVETLMRTTDEMLALPRVEAARIAPVPAVVATRTAAIAAVVAALPTPVRVVVAALPQAPDFRISLYQGEEKLGATELNLSDLRGTPVILNFWAGLCPPCRAEMPMLQVFYDAYGDRVTLLGIDVGPFIGMGSSQDGMDLLEELDISYPAGSIPDSGVVRSFLRAMPSTVFITAGGEIFRSWSGVLDVETLMRITDEMLGLPRVEEVRPAPAPEVVVEAVPVEIPLPTATAAPVPAR